MDYFSEDYFRRYNYRDLNESRNFSERDRNAPLGTHFDVFLSYNINDLDVVKGIFNKLSIMGYRVYLDYFVDPTLKTRKTDKETAEIIHDRLTHSGSLIYAQSENANQSNWMPWEIGVVDGRKRKCLILPVSMSDKSIPQKREYLFLYPYIMRGISDTVRIDSDYKDLSGLLLEDYLRYY